MKICRLNLVATKQCTFNRNVSISALRYFYFGYSKDYDSCHFFNAVLCPMVEIQSCRQNGVDLLKANRLLTLQGKLHFA